MSHAPPSRPHKRSCMRMIPGNNTKNDINYRKVNGGYSAIVLSNGGVVCLGPTGQ